jgi:hypothetical protein
MAGLTPELDDFLRRLVRLDAAALVRVRRAASDRAVVWARVPWDVLVARTLTLSAPLEDATYRAADWLSAADLAALARRDADWRGGVPAAAAVVLEEIPTEVVRRVGAAAESTLRETTRTGLNGRAVGSRVVRDALLDHVPIVVTPAAGTGPVEVPQRLVQAVLRMGLLESVPDTAVRVVAAGPWVGISTGRGVAWWRPAVKLGVRPHSA